MTAGVSVNDDGDRGRVKDQDGRSQIVGKNGEEEEEEEEDF